MHGFLGMDMHANSMNNVCVFHACYMHVFMHIPYMVPAHSMETCMSMCCSCTFYARNMHSHHAYSMHYPLHVVHMVPHFAAFNDQHWSMTYFMQYNTVYNVTNKVQCCIYTVYHAYVV